MYTGAMFTEISVASAFAEGELHTFHKCSVSRWPYIFFFFVILLRNRKGVRNVFIYLYWYSDFVWFKAAINRVLEKVRVQNNFQWINIRLQHVENPRLMPDSFAPTIIGLKKPISTWIWSYRKSGQQTLFWMGLFKRTKTGQLRSSFSLESY